MIWNPNPNDHIAIIRALFHTEITQNLETGALKKLRSHMPESQITLLKVPGAFEIPLALQWVLEKHFCGAIALGAIIRGETSNADHIASHVERSCSQLQLKYQKPIGFGVLTTETKNQALARSSLQEEKPQEEIQREKESRENKKDKKDEDVKKIKGDKRNKGEEAASALIQMLELKDRIGKTTHL